MVVYCVLRDLHLVHGVVGTRLGQERGVKAYNKESE